MRVTRTTGTRVSDDVIHEAFFKDGSEAGAIILGLQSQNILPLARLQDGFGTAVIFTLQ